MTFNQSLFMSEKEDWGTPQDLFNKLHTYFNFTLDPCSSHTNHKCEKYFTIEEDGLSQSWEGETVFMNPPYGKQLKDWMKKAYEESKKGTTIVCLVPSRTDTQWFHNYAYGKGEVVFFNRRLEFEGSNNKAPFPACLVIFNPKSKLDIEHLKVVELHKKAN
ncbi:DNA N-6-adenine-methyltransferase [Priestia megaterium]